VKTTVPEAWAGAVHDSCEAEMYVAGVEMVPKLQVYEVTASNISALGEATEEFTDKVTGVEYSSEPNSGE